MADPLPEFRYHPDPVRSGVIQASESSCLCCGLARGWVYTGPLISEREELVGRLCPWCIADGRAAEDLDVTFVDERAVGGYGEWATVDDAVVAAVSQRTPAFRGWQQERWFTCCGDAAVFLGPAGWREIQAAGTEAVRAIKKESGFDGQDWEDYFAEITADGEVTAYLFRCRTCGAIGGYTDCA